MTKAEAFEILSETIENLLFELIVDAKDDFESLKLLVETIIATNVTLKEVLKKEAKQ